MHACIAMFWITYLKNSGKNLLDLTPQNLIDTIRIEQFI